MTETKNEKIVSIKAAYEKLKSNFFKEFRNEIQNMPAFVTLNIPAQVICDNCLILMEVQDMLNKIQNNANKHTIAKINDNLAKVVNKFITETLKNNEERSL